MFRQSGDLVGKLLGCRCENFVLATKYTHGAQPAAHWLVTGDSREAMIAGDAYFSRADCTELMIAAARWPARGHRGRSTAQLDSEVAR